MVLRENPALLLRHLKFCLHQLQSSLLLWLLPLHKHSGILYTVIHSLQLQSKKYLFFFCLQKCGTSDALYCSLVDLVMETEGQAVNLQLCLYGDAVCIIFHKTRKHYWGLLVSRTQKHQSCKIKDFCASQKQLCIITPNVL